MDHAEYAVTIGLRGNATWIHVAKRSLVVAAAALVHHIIGAVTISAVDTPS
jgi:hypothetical protein